MTEPLGVEAFGEHTKKLPWDERAELIRKNFPSVDRVHWGKVFKQDPTIAGRIINDIIKIGGGDRGKPGKRPSLGQAETAQKFRQILDEDYTMLPFTEAFKLMCKGLSIRGVAAKTGLNRNTVDRLLNGVTPSMENIEAIAVAFKKDPGFFLEYRLYYISASIFAKLAEAPESSIVFYKKLKT